MTSTIEKLVNRVSQLENSTNQQGTFMPQLVTTPLYPYFHTDHASSKFTLETAMNQCQSTSSPPFEVRNANSTPATIREAMNSSNISNLATGQLNYACNAAGTSTNVVGMPNQLRGFRTGVGFSSESLPQVELVSPMIRRKIIEGKNINLAVLLISYYEGAMTNDERSDLYSCSTKKPDLRLNKILDLSSFMKAFGIYKSIMTEVYPQRQRELDAYERCIIDMGIRYPGSGFYEYHRQFSAKAAAYLEQHTCNIKIDWSIRDNVLYTNIFTGQQAVACRLCHSLSHDTSFCPQTLIESTAITNRVHSNQHFKGADSRGRLEHFYNDLEICNNFNGLKGCFRNKCSYSHICLSCHKNHPQPKCPGNPNKSSESKNEQAHRNKVNK